MTLKHIPFTPTAEQRANLLRLAAHLDLGVTNHQFDMLFYYDENECGTVACACGHGPSLGIGSLKTHSFSGEPLWGAYALDSFGVETHDLAWDWLFSSTWPRVDNTPRGAAARIYYALKHGIPENYRRQIIGIDPLSYEVKPFVEHVAQKVMA